MFFDKKRQVTKIFHLAKKGLLSVDGRIVSPKNNGVAFIQGIGGLA